MSNNAPCLQVALVDHAAIVKVNGRANFTTSVSFKRLLGELREHGVHRFVLDLTECVTMDSTFLGVLAGTALRFAEAVEHSPVNGSDHSRVRENSHLHLLNPNERVTDLLDNLGVSDLFSTLRCDAPVVSEQALNPAETPKPTQEELSRACLEAHQFLMEIDPRNIPKFKDVAQFLAEDLRRLTSKTSDSASEANPDASKADSDQR